MGEIISFFQTYFSNIYRPNFEISDFLEIAIIAVFIYEFILWVKNSRAWSLLKGILVIVLFVVIAAVFRFTAILWIFEKLINVAIIAVVIIFQPELRKALEQLGKKRYFSGLFPFDETREKDHRFSDKTIDEIIKASYEMAKKKTGALIVIEQDILLDDYIRTGITVDGLVTSQLLINIFEHNTPLHDGAVIVRGDRVVSATCYLPLSDNMGLSKELGTRHRAGAGISEVSDSFTIICSEETGKVSVAYGGELNRNVDSDYLRSKLKLLQKGNMEEKPHIKLFKRGGKSVEKKDIQ